MCKEQKINILSASDFLRKEIPNEFESLNLSKNLSYKLKKVQPIHVRFHKQNTIKCFRQIDTDFDDIE